MLSPTLLISINLIIGERESEKEKKKKKKKVFVMEEKRTHNKKTNQTTRK